MAILVNWWILPIGRVSGVEGLRSTELPRLVFFHIEKNKTGGLSSSIEKCTDKSYCHINCFKSDNVLAI